MSFDLWLLRLINGLAGHTPIVDQIMQALVSDYIGPTLQVLGLLGFWFEGQDGEKRRYHQRAVLRAVAAFALSSAIVKLSNLVYFRNRPFRYHDINVLFYYPSDSSFPSNSATVVFSLATCIWLCNRRWGLPLMLLATGFAFSRVYTGVHYPSDILVGFILGAGSAWLLTRFGQRLDRLFDVVINLVRFFFLA